jgi:RNA-directed DNA polymerase
MNNGMTSPTEAKAFEITKREVYEAWKVVKANGGKGGVDGEGLEEFESKLSKNLYKLWNRMSSGSYFPEAVRRVEIPKKDGSKRPLGIPAVIDRVAQQVVKVRLERELEPIFCEDSYGYRPGKSALEAVAVCRERNWQLDWVLDVDIQQFFDSIDHKLLLLALRKHCKEKWMMLYIERWLKAPMQHPEGEEEARERGTPQGGVISPLLANLYLHYAFDKWMERNHPSKKYERYADDVIIHCSSEAASHKLKADLVERFAECGLRLHPDKTKVVYCKDYKRKKQYPQVSYTFLGYTFKPRRAKGKGQTLFTTFTPAVSQDAQKHIHGKVRALKLRRQTQLSLNEFATKLNRPMRGWLNYFSQHRPNAVWYVCFRMESMLLSWVRRKYRKRVRQAQRWLARIRYKQPQLFSHWAFLYRPKA